MNSVRRLHQQEDEDPCDPPNDTDVKKLHELSIRNSAPTHQQKTSNAQ